MKKYLVIGNPIDHSLSPLLHNFWIRKHSIDAIYEKKLLKQNDIETIISEMRKKKIRYRTGTNSSALVGPSLAKALLLGIEHY